MAYLASEAIITRVKEVCDSAAGQIRLITNTRFTGDWHDELPIDEQVKRASTGPRFDVSFGAIKPNEASPPTTGNLFIYDVEIFVSVARHMWLSEQLTEVRDQVFALSLQDADVLRQALTYAGNLTETEAGTPTGLASGRLDWKESNQAEVEYAPAGGCVVKTIHKFTGIAIVRVQSSALISNQGGNFPNEA